MADYLAGLAATYKENTTNNLQISTIHIYFSHNLYREIEEISLLDLFNAFKENTTAGYRYFNKVKEKPGSLWFKYFSNLNRKEITSINRILSGHVQLNDHLYKKNLIQDPSCPYGYKQQTLEHFFFECPELSSGTSRLLTLLQALNLDIISLNNLYTDPKKAIPIFLKFIEDCNIAL